MARVRIEQEPETLRCRLLGCDFDFYAEGRTLRWVCARGCPTTGSRDYPTAGDAQRMAWGLQPRRRTPNGFLAALGGTVMRKAKDDGQSSEGGGAK